MKCVILAGGRGSRISEETSTRPKPMVEIGGHPILWHIMQHYAHYGFDDFVLALGYKADVIKKYILEYHLMNSSIEVSMGTGDVTGLSDCIAPANWQVSLVDTGLKTQTGGRIKRLKSILGNERFMLTWGDGLSDLNLHDLLKFHEAHGKLATVTAVRPPARFGHLEIDGDQVVEFSEKPQTREGWINGAFFVLEPQVLDYIDDDTTHFEREPMERLAQDGQLMAYRHDGFWQCMDTLRDKVLLDRLWNEGDAPWVNSEFPR